MRYKYSDEELKIIVSESYCLREVLQKLNIVPAGGNYFTIRKRIKKLCINTSHFTGQGWNKGKTIGPKRPISDYFNNKYYIYSHKLRQRILKENILEHRCFNCKLSEWLN